MSLEEKLKLLPDRCGVYLFKDKKGKILYIGKALSLKKRVRSYFQKGQFSPRIGALVRRIEDVEWIVTESEAEAFLLESNLIKHHHPKYNIRFRDDKSYPYIKLSTNEEFPAVFLTRNPKRDKALYFGPYTNVKAAKKTLRLIHRLFPLRRCKDKFKTRLSPCLNFYIKECSAPCVGRISKKDYDTLVQNVSLFLQGHYQTLVSQLEEKMLEASKNLEFEKAAKIRDTIRAINQVAQTQAVTSFPGEDMDLIAVARNKKDACLMVFMIREGKVIDKNHFLLRINTQDKDEEILSSFIKQYYARTSFVPPQIIVPGKVEEKEKITRWLSSKKGEKVKITSPREKDKKRLLELAEENARFFLVQEKGEGEEEGLHQLKEYLGLSEIPFRIEGFDISNIAGEEATGAVVVFEEGRPKKSEYRKFTIKTVSKIDDFAMLNEVVRRRYKRVVEENKNLPQLILVDGGKGQVSACLKALKEIGLESIPVIGLAKEFEKVFTARENRSLDIPLNSAAMKLLQRIRDEAHRFAHLHHRKKREKKIEKSELEKIPGIGENIKKLLLSHFGSLKNLKEAKLEELTNIPGIGEKRARIIKKWLQENLPEK